MSGYCPTAEPALKDHPAEVIRGVSRKGANFYIAGLSVFSPGFMLACFLAWAMYIFTWSACS